MDNSFNGMAGSKLDNQKTNKPKPLIQQDLSLV